MKWPLGKVHKDYGVVGACGVRDGEAYRMFNGHDGVISLIPLQVLEEDLE